MRKNLRRLLRWMDQHPVWGFNPAVQFRQQTPRD